MAAAGALQECGGDLVNCQFSVNQAALHSMVRPMLLDVLRETRHEDRLSCLEDALERAHLGLERKADAASLRDAVGNFQEQRHLLNQKADQRSLNEVKANLGELEEVVAWKAWQTALDEVASSVKIVAQLVEQKADLSCVNRINERVQKLAQASSRQDNQLADLHSAREAMEACHLPQTLQRTRDTLQRTGNSLKALQEVVSTKADQLATDELVIGLRDIECHLNSKADQQSIVELSTSVHGLKQQLSLKADQLDVDESRSKLDRLDEQLELKAEKHVTCELGAGLQAAQRALGQKADAAGLTDAKARCFALEAKVEQKVDRQDVGEVKVAMEEVRDMVGRKLEQLAAELPRQPQALARVELLLDELREATAQKADVETVGRRFDEVGGKIDEIAEQLRLKVGQKQVEEKFTAILETLQTLDSASFGDGSPASSASASITTAATPSTSASAFLPGKNPYPRSTRRIPSSKN